MRRDGCDRRADDGRQTTDEKAQTAAHRSHDPVRRLSSAACPPSSVVRRPMIRFDDIGPRLKAFRLGSGLSAEEIAQKLGISRTALYRFEKGEVAKIETLE